MLVKVLYQGVEGTLEVEEEEDSLVLDEEDEEDEEEDSLEVWR